MHIKVRKNKIIQLGDGIYICNKWGSENSDKMKGYDSKYFGKEIDKTIIKVLDNDTENKYVS